MNNTPDPNRDAIERLASELARHSALALEQAKAHAELVELVKELNNRVHDLEELARAQTKALLRWRDR